MRLARVGYENVAGLLGADPTAWSAAGLPTTSVRLEPMPAAVSPGRRVLEVRRQHEREAGHIEDATHVPLAQLPARVQQLEGEADWVVLCASGYRSMIATSILERAGFRRISSGAGGMDAWRREGRPMVTGE